MGAPSQPAPQPSADTNPASTLQPQQGGTFQTVGLRPLEHLNPWTQSTPQNATFYLNGGVYDQLVDNAYSPEEDHRFAGKIVPELAERWELTDNTQYTFMLRKNVKWHDGEPLTPGSLRDVAEAERGPHGGPGD